AAAGDDRRRRRAALRSVARRRGSGDRARRRPHPARGHAARQPHARGHGARGGGGPSRGKPRQPHAHGLPGDERAVLVPAGRPVTYGPPQAAVRDAVARALAEDLLPLGDLTAALLPPDATACAVLSAREP